MSPSIRINPDHEFYYFPDIMVDEVVFFSIARMPVFHSAFADPDADDITEDQFNFEYRVGLLA